MKNIVNSTCEYDEPKKDLEFDIKHIKSDLQKIIDNSHDNFRETLTKKEFINLQIDNLIKLERLVKDLEILKGKLENE